MKSTLEVCDFYKANHNGAKFFTEKQTFLENILTFAEYLQID